MEAALWVAISIVAICVVWVIVRDKVPDVGGIHDRVGKLEISFGVLQFAFDKILEDVKELKKLLGRVDGHDKRLNDLSMKVNGIEKDVFELQKGVKSNDKRIEGLQKRVGELDKKDNDR